LRILVTGCNSFLGQEISNSFLSKKYELILADRKVLDVSREWEVDSFFINNQIDVVIHTAIKGGRRNCEDTFSDFANNIKMFNNLMNNSDRFELMFNFGSGAEFNRQLGVKEGSESNFVPRDFYGLAKNLITKEIKRHNSNIVNLRLFGCFGIFEEEDRFIKNSAKNLLANRAVLIHKDKKMDFVSAEDVCKVIEFYIENFSQGALPIDLNLCYEQKHTLKNIADEICRLMNLKNNVIIAESGMAPEYTGCAKKIKQVGVIMDGLESGLRRMIKSIEEVR